MISFDVKNRFTGNVQFTAKIDCDANAVASVKMGLAVMWAVKRGENLRGAKLRDADLRGAKLRDANLRDADLRGVNLVDANLGDANLRGANLWGANLVGAYLVDADLRDAYLRGANLRDAYLRGAYLRGANLVDADIIHCGARSDGYEFFAHERDGELWITAGCRYFRIKDAKKHWKALCGGTPLGDESLQLVKNAVRLAKIRGIRARTTKGEPR